MRTRDIYDDFVTVGAWNGVEGNCFTGAVNGNLGPRPVASRKRQELDDVTRSRRVKERQWSRPQARTSECCYRSEERQLQAAVLKEQRQTREEDIPPKTEKQVELPS